MALASRWTASTYSFQQAHLLSETLGLSHATASILVRRGYGTPAAARRFLAADESHDPIAFGGIGAASKLILDHLERGTQIVVHGDYDVDGVCSTAIMVRALRTLGADPRWHLPARSEGYGLGLETVRRLAVEGVGLLVTVDCAITAVDEISAAKALGMDVVVTDHHRPAERLPDCPIVHPAVCGYPFEQLCAAAVAHKLSSALFDLAGRHPSEPDHDLDLVALATIADVVPLLGENRRLVREGLVALARTRKPGLRALMEIAAVAPGALDERAVGFRLAPRLNAAGRLAHADAALELVLTEDGARAAEIADELDLLNRERQDTETRILFAAEAARAELSDAAAYVVAGEGWHPGVIGIVAGRLAERHHRPCVVIAVDGDVGRGSGRSIDAFDLHAGLGACADHLLRFGGHRAAAGLELERDRIDGFRTAFAEHAGAALSPADLVPLERVDAVVSADEVGIPLAEELQRLAPFGHGNPPPALLVPAARVTGVRAMGDEGQHARFTLEGGGQARGVAFRTTARSLLDVGAERQDAAVTLELNEWRGAVEPRLILRALCPTAGGTVAMLGEEKFWPCFERELLVPLDDRVTPSGPLNPRHSQTPQPSHSQTPQPSHIPPVELAAVPQADDAPDEPFRAAGDAPAGDSRRTIRDCRGAGFAGIAGDLLSSGQRLLIVCADPARRRGAIAGVLAGMAGRDTAGTGHAETLALIGWDALAADPTPARASEHLIALDPPDSPAAARLLERAPCPLDGGFAHLAWGPEEIQFARVVAARTLGLRSELSDLYRCLRETGPCNGDSLERVLRGDGAYPRSPRLAARLVRVLRELGLITFESTPAGARCSLLEAKRTELERSASYRAYLARLDVVDAYLTGGLSGAVRAA